MTEAEGSVIEREGKTTLVFPEALPILPVRDLVVFPYMMAPLVVSREISARAVDAALDEGPDRLILLCAQRRSVDDPRPEDVHEVGCVGMIVKLRRLSDGRQKILVQGLARARVTGWEAERGYLRARYQRLADAPIDEARRLESEALMRAGREAVERWAQGGKVVSPELTFAVGSAEDPGRLADLVAAHLAFKVAEAQPLLEELAPLERLSGVIAALRREIDILDVRARIETRAREEMSKTQREFFLREQIRAIRTELGDLDAKGVEIDELRARLRDAALPEDAAREADKQLRRLEQMSGEAAEAATTRAWLDWVVELPWTAATADRLDLAAARRVLDEDHWDLRHVKDRILEYLAVRKLRGGAGRGPILCFAGPPGVGKTSLGRSIARALGRRFVRISLGGVRDEGEIRGHRRTYVGALPGRILQAMKQAGTVNPVVMLDEIDKLGTEYRGDPSSALLEVLDPEQNHAFRDHYLGLSYDLAQVLYITTANHEEAIPGPLRDRMEVLRLPGYSVVEKLAIARRFLVPRQLEAAGLGDAQLAFTPRALRAIVSDYTREAGLRDLERRIAAVARKCARRVAERGPGRPVRVTAASLGRWLGAPPFPAGGGAPGEDAVGVATGLAWTPYGGELLTVEVQAMPGKGAFTLTGQLGDVMRESAQAALSIARARAAGLGLPENFFGEREIHVHVPAGAVPKDGPSAGVTMAVALVSLLSGRPVRCDVAMTGEITLRGRILPVGGLKEKLLAAARAPGIARVIVPDGNLREIADLPRHLRARLEIVGAKTLDDALAAALREAARPAAVRTLGS